MSCGATSTCQASRRLSASRAITAKTSATSLSPADGIGEHRGRDRARVPDAVARPHDRRLGRRQRHRRRQRQAQPRAVDADERHPPRHEPWPQRRGVLGHDGAHGPALQVGDAGGQRVLRRGGRDADAGVVVDPRPAHRPEEADGVVLRAVALQVARDERLVLSGLGVALGRLRPAAHQHVDAGRQRVAVLPGDRLPQRRLAGRPVQGARTAAGPRPRTRRRRRPGRLPRCLVNGRVGRVRGDDRVRGLGQARVAERRRAGGSGSPPRAGTPFATAPSRRSAG